MQDMHGSTLALESANLHARMRATRVTYTQDAMVNSVSIYEGLGEEELNFTLLFNVFIFIQGAIIQSFAC